MKKKSVSKILALGLVSVMTAGMLAGCGGGTTSDTGAADTGSGKPGLRMRQEKRLRPMTAHPTAKFPLWSGGPAAELPQTTSKSPSPLSAIMPKRRSAFASM